MLFKESSDGFDLEKISNDKTLELFRIILYGNLKQTMWDYQPESDDKYEKIFSKKVKDLTSTDCVLLLQKWIFDYKERRKKELEEFSDEDIVGEMNRRIQNGTIDSSTRFHVTRKGTIN